MEGGHAMRALFSFGASSREFTRSDLN
jgi:hypothetical protein